MSFEAGQFLETLFGSGEAVEVAVVDPPQPDADASVDTVFAGRLEYSGEIANEGGLHVAAGVFDEVVDTTDPWPPGEAHWPDPCPACGSMELWENPLGDWRCMACDPPTKAIQLLKKTQRIRRRHGLENPAKISP